MTIRKGLLLLLSTACIVGLSNCSSTSVDSTGFNAEGEESAWDKETDFDNAQTSKLQDLEQSGIAY